MKLQNVNAFRPFFADRITLHAKSESANAGGVATLQALVTDRTEEAGPLGLAPQGDGLTVVFALADWDGPPVSRGSWIDPDPGPLHRWDKLTVASVKALGGLCFLRCSQRERV